MVSHADVRAWLDGTKKRGMALGLPVTQQALRALELGTATFETVHVAGSNGKGTTVASLCAALGLAEIRTLSFTSPHLIRVEERFRLNGVPADPALVDQALANVRAVEQGQNLELTFFEVTFLVAMWMAHATNVDVLVLETGLGGRLDATRVADADVCVLTSLSLEHTDVLGDTLTDIAAEKAAIARPNRPLVVRQPGDDAVRAAIEECAMMAGSSLLGETSAPAALYWVQTKKEQSASEEALTLARNTWPHLAATKGLDFPALQGVQWPARMQAIPSPRQSRKTYLLDGAHNPSGMVMSCAELRQRPEILQGPWALLFGSSPQREMRAMLEPLASLCRQHPPVAVAVTVPQKGRYPGVEADEMKKHLEQAGIVVDAQFSQPHEAVAWYEALESEVHTVVSLGSLYLQGNVMEALGADDQASLSIRAKV